MLSVPELRLISESGSLEVEQVVRTLSLPEDKMPCHSAPTGFGQYCYYLELQAIVNIEERLHDVDLALHTLPVEEVFVFFGTQMNERSAISLYCLDEAVGEQGFPKVENVLTSAGLQSHVAFKTVWVNGVERAQQSIEE